jgi:hypothetical protein
VAEDHLLGIFVEFAQGDEPAPLFDFGRARNPETLRIGEDTGIFLLYQNALLPPGAKIMCGPRVDAFAFLGVKEFRQAQNDAHQVEWTALVVSLLHGRRNLVVGLSHDVVQPDCGWVVTPGAEWIDAGHANGRAPH